MAARPGHGLPPGDAVEIIAHRGYSARAPENTLAALEAAIAAGADAVEFDLHVAADGTAVVFHDPMLDRTTNGTGAVRDRTLEELKRLDAGSWFGPEHRGEPIPSVEEAFEALRGRTGRVYAEIKGYRTLEDVDRLVELAARAGTLRRTVFISMDWIALDRVRALGAEHSIGFIVEHPSRADAAIARARDDRSALVDFDARILLADPRLARSAGAAGVPLAVWTVDDPAHADRLLEMGVERFTTNQVEIMASWKRGL